MIEALYPYISYIIFSVVLIELMIAVYLDLTTAKFPNQFFLYFIGVNFLLFVILRGLSGIPVSFITFGVAILLLAPIYFAKLLGGGDVKLILSVSPCLLLDEFISFLFMSFLWAGVFGILRSALGGNLRALLVNTFLASRKITVAENTMPFTVGILLGWCSYKSVLGLGFL